MKNLLSFSLISFALQLSLGQIDNYQALILKEKLTKKANSSVRHHSTHINFESIDKMIIQHKHVITVLNKNGNRDIDVFLYYDDNIKVKDIYAIAFDTSENEIKKFKKKTFEM